jgi:hypothetical protein
MHTKFPEFEDMFPYEYKSGGYFRLKNIPKKVRAHILHGEEAVRYIYEKLKEINLLEKE